MCDGGGEIVVVFLDDGAIVCCGIWGEGELEWWMCEVGVCFCHQCGYGDGLAAVRCIQSCICGVRPQQMRGIVPQVLLNIRLDYEVNSLVRLSPLLDLALVV